MFCMASQKLFKCGDCGLSYSEKTWAEKCEKWCKKHHTCNLVITRHAIKGLMLKSAEKSCFWRLVLAVKFDVHYKVPILEIFQSLVRIYLKLPIAKVSRFHATFFFPCT